MVVISELLDSVFLQGREVISSEDKTKVRARTSLLGFHNSSDVEVI